MAIEITIAVMTVVKVAPVKKVVVVAAADVRSQGAICSGRGFLDADAVVGRRPAGHRAFGRRVPGFGSVLTPTFCVRRVGTVWVRNDQAPVSTAHLALMMPEVSR